MAISARRPTSTGRAKLIRAAARLHTQQVARASSLVRSRLRRRNQTTAGYLGVEVKFFDQQYPTTTLPAPANPASSMAVDPTTTLSLVAVSQGDGPSNRDGKKIRLRSLYIKGTLFRPAYKGYTLPQEPMGAYVAVVLDRQCNAAQLSPAQVFINPQATALGNISLLRNLEYSDRYRILRDGVFLMGSGPLSNNAAADTFSSSGAIRHFEWYIPLNFDVQFNTTTPTAATVASIVSNNIGVVAAATINAVNDTIALCYTSRLRYVG